MFLNINSNVFGLANPRASSSQRHCLAAPSENCTFHCDLLTYFLHCIVFYCTVLCPVLPLVFGSQKIDIWFLS